MMEPQEEFCYEKKHCDKKNCKCLSLIQCILFALFIGTVGSIVGAICFKVLLINIAVLISFAVILGILFILTIIYKICACNKKR